MNTKVLTLFLVAGLTGTLSFADCDSFNPNDKLNSQEWCRAISIGKVVQDYERWATDHGYKMLADTYEGRKDVLTELMIMNEKCYIECMKVNKKF